MSNFRLIARFVTALAALAMVSACAGTTLTNAVTLSKAGQTAAAAAGQAAAASADQYAAYKDSDTFLHAFVGDTSKSPALVKAENQNQRELAGRAKMFSSLAAAYASLGDLAGYDASGQYQTDVSNLFSSINAYQKVVGPTVGGVVPPVTGQVAGLIQSHMVLAASEQLRPLVERIVAVMSDPLVREQFVGSRRLIVSQLVRNARLLAQRGLLSPKPFLDAMGQPLGMIAADNVTSVLKTDTLAARGLDALIASKQQAAIDLVDGSYDAGIAALRNLLPLHDKLRAGQPLNVARTDQAVQKLQSIAAAIKPSNAGAGK